MRPFFALAILVPSLGLAQDPTPARDALERFSDGLESLRAEFTQSLVSPEGQVQEEAEGVLWLARPDRLRWEFQGDFPEVIVADGQSVWQHDIELEQVTVRPQGDFQTGSPFMLLTDLQGLDEQFRVVEAGEFEGMDLLMLTAHEASAEFERILLGLDAEGVRLMTLEDAFGLRTEIRFEALERNPELGSELFEFTPPDGVDVVGMDPSSGQP